MSVTDIRLGSPQIKIGHNVRPPRRLEGTVMQPAAAVDDCCCRLPLMEQDQDALVQQAQDESC
jgi:hypothetical protein